MICLRLIWVIRSMGRGMLDTVAEVTFIPDTGALDAFWPEVSSALTIRAVEDRLLQLFSEGRLFGTVHTCIGQEFTGVAVSRCLLPDDYVISNHRCHGHFLSYGGSMPGLIAEIMGKSTGVCGGRGGSQHLFQGRFMSNGIQGGIAPVAAGLSFAHKLHGTNGIAVVYLGDGTMGQGVLYETLNIASKWQLPVLFVVENNQYAQSTSAHQTLSGSIRKRFEAFGIEGMENNTWEWDVLLQDVQANIASMRTHGGPRYHLVDTYRLKPHSKGDDFRQKEEIKAFEERDPLSMLVRTYAGNDRLQSLLSEIQAKVDAAVDAAEKAPFGHCRVEAPQMVQPAWQAISFEKERCVHAIQAALDKELGRNQDSVMIGEDMEAPYGGAFKVAGDLSAKYPGRVRNTPISEAAIVGISNGLALAGFRSMVEIMFGDFLTLGTDQWINHAAKFEWMYNGQTQCPVVIRTPMGGRRGYGPTHSQSLEKHFLGLPGTQVLALHHRYSPRLLYRALFENTRKPTLVIENKRLYASQVDSTPPDGFQLLHSQENFPTTWLSSGRAADITILAIGGTSIDAEAATLELFDNHDAIADLFMPSCLYPFQVTSMEDSILKSRRLLIVEEGLGFASLSSEIMAQVQERWPDAEIRCTRLTAKESPIPTSRPMEEELLPTQEVIVETALRCIHG